MKILVVMLVVTLVACGKESSPEGRSQLRDERLEQKIDSLARQNKAILDSISQINKELRILKRSRK